MYRAYGTRRTGLGFPRTKVRDTRHGRASGPFLERRSEIYQSRRLVKYCNDGFQPVQKGVKQKREP
jgi:hypothetical protein